ncbi:MAG: hypothetical protein IPM31_16975 [Anaerolineae bacterium]|nr:hypothetical protein [Anaerolineae bacterium]
MNDETQPKPKQFGLRTRTINENFALPCQPTELAKTTASKPNLPKHHKTNQPKENAN